jgi:uncharacterized membrane protein
MTEQTSASAISKSRLEFLFDGVFAIAMTILVLELRVPELVDRRSIDELARALAHDTPTFGSYLVSFAVLGVCWHRHNHLYHHYRSITPGMLVLHFVQLAAAAFFPFCAALFGRYPANPLGGVFYVGCIMVYLWASLANWVGARRWGAMEPGVTPAEFRRRRARLLRGCLAISSLFAIYVFKVIVK